MSANNPTDSRRSNIVTPDRRSRQTVAGDQTQNPSATEIPQDYPASANQLNPITPNRATDKQTRATGCSTEIPFRSSHINEQHSTPWSRGTSSNYHALDEATRSDYAPFIIDDLMKHQKLVKVEDFLSLVFNLTPDWIQRNIATLNAVSQDAEYQKLSKDYQATIQRGTEAAMYHPFVLFANHALTSLEEKAQTLGGPHHGDGLRFCRNDKQPVYGSKSKRVPDCLALQEKLVVGAGLTRHVESCARNGPEKNPFFWVQVLAFLEFKSKKYNSDILVGGKPVVQPDEELEEIIPSVPSQSHSQNNPSTSRQAGITGSEQGAAQSQPTNPAGHPFSVSKVATASYSSNQKRPRQDDDATALSSNKMQKAISKATKRDPKVQCASYALELLSSGGYRDFALGILIEDDRMHFLYYDRSIILISEPLHFLKQPQLFLAALCGFNSQGSRRWGFNQFIGPPVTPKTSDVPKASKVTKASKVPKASKPSAPPGYVGKHVALSNGFTITLSGKVDQQHSLIGRGTAVFGIATVDYSGDDAEMKANLELWRSTKLVMKISNPQARREPEYDIISAARQLATETETCWVLDHLPLALHYESDKLSGWDPMGTLAKHFPNEYELRECRLMILEELEPITNKEVLDDHVQAAIVFYGVLETYNWLHTKLNLIHRDLSHTNIMYRKVGSKIYGVLNDYDLAVTEGADSSASGHRTGTTPFIAMELVGPSESTPCHLYRHDLESLFYIIAWHRFQLRGHKGFRPFDRWAASLNTSWESKTAFVTQRAAWDRLYVANESSPDVLVEYVDSMRLQLSMGYSELNHIPRRKGLISPFDTATLNNHITYEKWRDIMTEDSQVTINKLCEHTGCVHKS